MPSSRQASQASDQATRRPENVVDLDAFRRERARMREATMDGPVPANAGAVMVPVWVCWVPVWGPMQSL